MAENLTIGDLQREAEGILSVESHQGADALISEHDALVWLAHHRPDTSRVVMPLDGLGSRYSGLADFYRGYNGARVQDLGNIMGDLGATEISKGLHTELAEAGLKPLLLYPSLGGRVGVDWNRAPGEKGIMVKMPSSVEATHIEMHKKGIDLLYRTVEEMATNLKVVLQPHTMAAGEFDEAESDAVVTALKALNPEALDYSDKLNAAVEAMRQMYSRACNSGPRRTPVDLVVGYKDQPNLPGDSLAIALQTKLTDAGIEAKQNDPFPHAPGYPGSVLIEKLAILRANAGLPPVPQVCFDASKHLVTPDIAAGHFDSLRSRADQAMVNTLVAIVMSAIKETV